MTTDTRAEVRYLNDADIALLDKQLPLTGKQRIDLRLHNGERHRIQETIQGVVDRFACIFENETAPGILFSKSRLLLAEQDLATYRDDATSLFDSTRREVLTDPDFRPPLFWKAVGKVLAIREPNPEIEAKRHALAMTGADLSRREFEAERSIQAMLRREYEEYEKLKRVEEQALAVFRAAAITSDQALETFVEVAPWQASRAAKDYAERVVANPDITKRAEGFQGFVDFMFETFHYPVTKPEYKVTSEDGWKDIEKRGLQSCWEAYLEYKKLKEFADKGLVPQPQVPDIIQRRGPRLNF